GGGANALGGAEGARLIRAGIEARRRSGTASARAPYSSPILGSSHWNRLRARSSSLLRIISKGRDFLQIPAGRRIPMVSRLVSPACSSICPIESPTAAGKEIG